MNSLKDIMHDLEGMRGYYINLRYDIVNVFRDNNFNAAIEIKNIVNRYELLGILIYSIPNSNVPLLRADIELIDSEYILKNIGMI